MPQYNSNPMLKIDGSYGEGGGQIIRTAVAMSALTGKAIEIQNIRANRQNPGLQPQHLTAVEAVRQLCGAEVEGLEKGSRKIVFKPGEIKGGAFSLDVGTAGNIPLIFQCCLPAALFAPSPVRLKITGGTDTKMAPPIDYLRSVFLPIVSKMGVNATVELFRRGYYPKGGGQAIMEIAPCKELRLIQISEQGAFSYFGNVFCAPTIPEHVPERIKKSAMVRIYNQLKQTPKISTEISESFSPGVGIALWAKSDKTIIGSSALGERGVPSEKVADDAVNALAAEVQSGATVDVHALDQLVPYMALASGKSEVLAREVSQHACTNMWVVEKFLDVKFEIKHEDKLWRVSVNGAGFKR
ncbi:MAG: RNA 3'-terminal phosphate cyclase [Candidatus Thermoplasmatota archaeon]|nr:RNA 3'-terminal phosphate cyclase [Candidatus Thermoplasmatota archaeon]